MGLFKFLTKSIPDGKKREIIVYQKWIVRWGSRSSKYQIGLIPEAEFFTDEQSAKLFYNNLKDAQSILKYTEDINISISKE